MCAEKGNVFGMDGMQRQRMGTGRNEMRVRMVDWRCGKS